MMAATSRREVLLHLLGIDRAVGARRNRLDPVAEQRGGRRIGAVRGIRHQHDRALFAARRERRLDRHHAAQLAVRAGLRRHRDRRHAGQLAQPARQLGDQRDRARHGRLRLQRMDVAEARAAAPSSRSGADCASWCTSRAETRRCRCRSSCATAARSGASPPARRGPAGRSVLALEAAEARLERRRLVESTPVTSVRPISKISASSMLQRAVAGEGLRRGRDAPAPVRSAGLGGSHASTSFSAAT